MLPHFASAANVTTCGTISSSGTYILQNDISSTGTCMTISAGNVVLDLNGHSITYNTAAGDNVYGVVTDWNIVGIRIHNGSFVQGAGNGYQSSGIYSRQASNWEIDHLTMHYQGDNNFGINLNGGSFASGASVHNNFIYPNGTKRSTGAVRATIANGGSGYSVGQHVTLVGGTGGAAVFTIESVASGGVVTSVMQYDLGDYTVLPPTTNCQVAEAGGLLLNVLYGPSHYGGFSAISVGSMGGDISIADNYIEGKGYSGIDFGYTNITPPTSTVEITGNTVKMAAPVRDGYAISIGSGSNDNVGFEIANNTIIQSSGRGILVAGNYNENSPGPGLGTIHDNNIDVRESHDGEYDTAGTSLGIQLRFGAHDVQIYNNTVHAHAGAHACPVQFPVSLGDDCTAVGIKVMAGQNAVNNVVHNNTVEVETTDSNLIAMGLYGDGQSDGSNIFYNNTVTSNSTIIDLASGDGFGSNFLFRSNTFIKGASPQGFHSIISAYWTSISVDNVFLDNIWQNGAGVDDVMCSSSGAGNYSLFLKWYLNVSVKDVNTNLPIIGATVSVNATGASEIVNATTDDSGNAQLILTNYKRYGNNYPATTNYTQYGPQNITIAKTGYNDVNSSVTMDSTKGISLSMNPAAPNTVAPSAPSGLSVQ